MPIGEAFHPFLAGSADLILGVVAHQEIGTGWVGDVHRIEAAFSALVRNRLFSGSGMVHIVEFIVPVHTTPYQTKIVISDLKQPTFRSLECVNTVSHRPEIYFSTSALPHIKEPFDFIGFPGGPFSSNIPRKRKR